MKNPIQPLEKDKHGTIRFKENKIVSYILDNGGIDLNAIAMKDFTNDDREQFAQLIGYSLSGFADLDYVSDETYYTAEKMSEGKDEKDARIEHLQNVLEEAREHTRKLSSVLFKIYEEDLKE